MDGNKAMFSKQIIPKRTRGSAEKVLEGYILDVSSRVKNENSVILLTIKKLNGFVELVEFYGMKPYCYLRYSSFADVDAAITTLNGIEGVVSVVKTKKSDYGKKDILLLKVFTTTPKKVSELRDSFLSVDGIVDWEEADIPFNLRFIIDYDIQLCRKMRMIVVERFKGFSYAEKIRDNIEYTAEFEPFDLSYVSFDIEVWNEDVVTRPEKDKILMIGLDGKDMNGTVHQQLFSLDDYKGTELQKERRMIGAFLELVHKIDPDLIISYNGTSYDLEYMYKRCKFLGTSFAIGKNKSELYLKEDDNKGPKKRKPNIIIPGRINYDLLPIAKRDIGDLPHKTLKNVADYTGILKHEERVEIPYERIWKWWEAGGRKRELIKFYCMDDTISTARIGMEVFITNMVALSYITHVPLQMAMTQRYGFLNAHFISRYLYNRGMLIPKKDLKEGQDLVGAEVLPGSRGIFDDVECWDFKSMYPSIIISQNLSFETLVTDDESYSPDDVTETAGGKYKFLKASVKKGILPIIEEEYLRARAEYKKIWKSKTDDDPDKGMYEALQLTYKRLANAMYGMTAQRKHAARFYFYPIADSITHKSRASVLAMARIAEEEFGGHVIYGDTDSIYIKKIDKLKLFDSVSAYKITPIEKQFLDRIYEHTGIELELDYPIQRFFSEGKKKRYFFRKVPRPGQIHGDLVVRGYEFRRGDWVAITKKAQELVMKSILDTGDCDKALKISNVAINILRGRRFKISDVTISKELKKDITEYDERHGQVHVAVAEREMLEFGVAPEVGAKNGVVIVDYNKVKKYYPRTTDKLSDEDMRSKVTNRAVLANRVHDLNDIDTDYYINHQIVKPIARILSVFGVKNEAIIASTESLDDMADIDLTDILNEV